ncbi:MAG TPA: hypothetical protein VJV40_01525 [Thermodesulfobacteriota bacterium]|nr:hypothetical protein [Thermodesulfobacteriota bacterium]
MMHIGNHAADVEDHNGHIERIMEDVMLTDTHFKQDYGDLLDEYVSWIKSNIRDYAFQMLLITDFILFALTIPDKKRARRFIKNEKERILSNPDIIMVGE